MHSTYIRKTKAELLDYEPDDDGIPTDISEAPWNNDERNLNTDPISPLIFGSEELQSDLRTLCEEYKDIFSTELRPEPALIPPMELNVDIKKWEDERIADLLDCRPRRNNMKL